MMTCINKLDGSVKRKRRMKIGVITSNAYNMSKSNTRTFIFERYSIHTYICLASISLSRTRVKRKRRMKIGVITSNAHNMFLAQDLLFFRHFYLPQIYLIPTYTYSP